MEEIKPTPEELAAEQEALKPVDKEAVRTQVVADLELDETDDAELISKAVDREVRQREITQAAIKAKIKHRTDAEEAAKKLREEKPVAPKPNEEAVKPLSEEDVRKAATSAAREALEGQYLEGLNLPEELQAEIRRVADIGQKSIREALKDPYIVSRVKEHEAEAASASQTHRSGKSSKFDVNNPPQVDMSTEEGRKAYDEWFEKARKAERG